jgi:hypothetical protein
MSALVEFLFPAPDQRRTARSLLSWWESRRLKYNLIVGSFGLFSLGFMYIVWSLPPEAHPMPFIWRPILAFGVMANVCYSAGWLAELTLEKLWGRKALPAGPTLFRQGLSFSVGLTLLPSLVSLFVWGGRIIHSLLF